MQINYREGDVPHTLILKAATQTRVLSLLRLGAMVITPVMAAVAVLCAKDQPCNRFGTSTTEFNPKYKARGAIGPWAFHSVPLKWRTGNLLQRFVWLWGNDKDGFNGDRRGEWAAISGYDEESFASRYWWNIRNPSNNLRYTDMFSCIPDNCTEVDIWGYDFELDNKPVIDEGWWFIRAQANGRTYYSYRAVKKHDEGKWAHNASIGFKLKPSHFAHGESENKGFTDRITPIF